MADVNLKLTDSQEAAIEHESGRLRVIACPGSGKTEIIARRVAKLIEKGEQPEGIVAITFTEKAAEELKRRIRKILDQECPERTDFGGMFIGTIHAFSLDLLRELDPYYRTFDVLDEAKRVAYISKGDVYYQKVKLVRLEKAEKLKHYQVIYRFLKSVDITLMERIDPADLSNTRFRECLEDYLRTTKEDRYFDFTTIIHRLVKELKEHPEKVPLTLHRTRHIIVDEFQDVDKLQNELIELLSKNARSVCVVGDDDQGIYNWRGTDVGIMRNFCPAGGKGKECTDIPLNINFRSTDGVVNLSRRFIEHNATRLPKKMVHNGELERRYEKGDIQYGLFDSEKQELDYIVSKIRELNGTDFLDKRNRHFSLSLRDFAVLTRTNDWAAKVMDRLDREGIDSIAYSGESIFERPEVQLAMDCIAYVFGCQRLNSDWEKYEPDERRLRKDYQRIFSQDRFPGADPVIFTRKLNVLRDEAARIAKRENKDYLPDLGLQGFYHRILEAMGADRFDFGEVFSYDLASLSRAISDYESVWVRLRASEVKWFFSFMGAYGKSVYTDSQHQDAPIINAVRILTIHKAKGLEFPVVFIPDFVKRRHWPPSDTFVDGNLYDHERYAGDDEDERRVYYTALTRSEKYIFLTGSRIAEGGKNERRPHPFLAELPDAFISDPVPLSRPRSGFPERLEVEGEYSTSYSELINYIRCPNDFLLRNIYGYNAGVPAAFGYGTNVHNVLNMIHREYIRSNRIPDENEIGLIVDRMFHLRYATGSMTEKMKESAKQVVIRYVAEHSRDFTRILETEKRFEFVLGEALIGGQIDLLKRLAPDGSIREVEIIDFKTDRSDSVYSADYERQLRYYAIACGASLNLVPKKAVVHHLDEGSKTEVDISEPVLENTRSEVKQVVSDILRKKFPAKPDKGTCSECDYRLLCPYKAA